MHYHYRTIVGLSGDDITYLDSNAKSDSVAQETITENIHLFLQNIYGEYGATELTWMSKVNAEALPVIKKDYSDLSVDPQTGEVVRRKGNTTQDDVAYHAGIVITKEGSRLRKKYPGIGGLIYEQIALHRCAFMNEEQEKEWYRKDKKYEKIRKVKIKEERKKADAEEEGWLLGENLENRL